MLKLLVLGSIFISVFLFAISYLKSMERRKENLDIGLAERKEWNEDTALLKLVNPLVVTLAPIISMVKVPTRLSRQYQQLIIGAGLESQVTVEDLFGLHIALPLIGYFIGMGIGLQPFAHSLIVIITIVLPFWWIYDLAKKRRDEIVRRLPDAVDLIALSVQGGLGFEESLRRATDTSARFRKNDPLLYEFKVLQQNMRLGRSTIESLQELQERVDRREMTSFASVLIQAQKFGASIASTLIEQSELLRSERFMNAEKKGAVASQKIMVPLMLFFFPLIFGVILFPFIIKYLLL